MYVHVHTPSQRTVTYLYGLWDVLLSDGRQQSREVNHPVNVVVHHYRVEVLQVHHIHIHVRRCEGVRVCVEGWRGGGGVEGALVILCHVCTHILRQHIILWA